MKTKVFGLIAILFVLAACTKETPVQPLEPKPVVISNVVRTYTLQSFGSDGDDYHYSYYDTTNQFKDFKGLCGDISGQQINFLAKEGSVETHGTPIAIVKVE